MNSLLKDNIEIVLDSELRYQDVHIFPELIKKTQNS